MNTTPSPLDSIALLYNPDKNIRHQAARTLAGYGTDILPLILPLLNNESWLIRYRACEILGLLKDPACSPHLLSKLHDPRDHVRYMAVKGLGLLGDPAAVPAVIPMLSDENPFVRRITVLTLNTLGGDEAQQAITDWAEQETDPAVRKACKHILTA